MQLVKRMLVKLGHHALTRGFRIPSPEFVSNYNQWGRTMDLIHRNNVNIVLDVGANRGHYAHHLRQSGYQGLIVSFEPIAAEHKRIVDRSNNDDLWQSFPWALGAEDGQKPFNVLDTADGGETVLSSFLTMTAASFSTKVQNVEIRRLDSILPEITKLIPDPRIFLKMDTQGLDLHVWEGTGTWQDKVCLLQSEISVKPLYADMPPYTQSLDVFGRAGFELCDLFIVRRTSSGNILEYDSLMERKAPS